MTSLVWFQERKVKSIYMHEQYDSSRITSDICILKLDSPLELNGLVPFFLSFFLSFFPFPYFFSYILFFLSFFLSIFLSFPLLNFLIIQSEKVKIIIFPSLQSCCWSDFARCRRWVPSRNFCRGFRMGCHRCRRRLWRPHGRHRQDRLRRWWENRENIILNCLET